MGHGARVHHERAARAHGAGRLDDHAAGGQEPPADARAHACSARCRRSSWRGGCREKLSKEDILALYLNQIYYGHGRYGCEEAARYFFGKSVRDINLAEAALLAGLPQSPERLSPRKHPDAAKARQRYVLGQMADHGFIERKDGRAGRGPADPAGARDRRRRAGWPPRRSTSSARAPVRQAGRVGRVRGRHDGRRRRWTRSCRSWRATSVERGPGGSRRAPGLPRPVGARDRQDAGRASAASWARRYAKFLKGSEIVEGIVLRFEKDATSPGSAKLGKLFVDVGAGVPAHAPAPPPAAPAGKGKLALKQKAPPPPPLPAADARGRRRLQPRAALRARGPKPLADRFKPGDLVRVRLAEDRPHTEDGPLPLALELGPQAAMVVMDPTTREVLALVGGYDYHAGGFDRSQRAHRQPGSAFKPIIYARRDRGPPDHARDDPERRARGLRAVEAAELREGRVPRPGARAHRAGALDQHRRDQGAVRRRARPGARVRDARRHHVADRERRRAVAGARIAGGDAAGAGERLRDVRQRRHRRAAGVDPRAGRRGAAAGAAGARR